jgi:transposase
LWRPTPADLQQLRTLLAREQELKMMHQQEANRLENGRLDAQTRSEIQGHLAFLEQQLDALEGRLQACVQASEELHAQVEVLSTIKGIGQLTAVRLVSIYGHGASFASVAQVVAYAGLNPSEHRSGTSVYGARSIPKQGRKQVRSWLYLCAITAKRWDPDMRQWAGELEARGKCKKVVIVAVMRKLLHIIYGLLKSGQAYDAQKAWPSHFPKTEGNAQAA